MVIRMVFWTGTIALVQMDEVEPERTRSMAFMRLDFGWIFI